MMIECYKCVWNFHNTLQSYYVFDEPLRCYYYENIWVHTPDHLYAQGYGLCAFQSLEDACKFISPSIIHPLLIYKCHGGHAMPLPPVLWAEEREKLAKGLFVRHPDHDDCVPCDYRAQWPHGTVMFESIKLIERIRI